MVAGDRPEQMIGAILAGRYRLVASIGSGPVGVVFEAHDLEEGGPCAVKTLRDGAAEPTEVIAAFLRDTRAARNLIHPNIALCHDTALAEDGAPYRVMELLDGAPLGSYLTPALAYDAKHVIPIGAAVLAALREAHDRNLVHGDVKPSNIFMARNGTGPPTVKLLDFGMAGVLAIRRSTSSLDAATAVESLDFLSPEQRDGDQADVPDDLWAVAVLLYRMLTGYAPSPVSGARTVRAAPSEPNMAYLGQAHLALFRGFFGKAFAHERAGRFASAGEMLRELEIIEVAAPPAPLAAITDLSPAVPSFLAQRALPRQVALLAQASAGSPAISLEATMPGADAPVVRAPPSLRVPWRLLFLVVLIGGVVGFAAGFVAGRF